MKGRPVRSHGTPARHMFMHVTTIEQVADDAAVLTRDDGQLAKLTDVTGERATVTCRAVRWGTFRSLTMSCTGIGVRWQRTTPTRWARMTA